MIGVRCYRILHWRASNVDLIALSHVSDTFQLWLCSRLIVFFCSNKISNVFELDISVLIFESVSSRCRLICVKYDDVLIRYCRLAIAVYGAKISKNQQSLVTSKVINRPIARNTSCSYHRNTTSLPAHTSNLDKVSTVPYIHSIQMPRFLK